MCCAYFEYFNNNKYNTTTYKQEHTIKIKLIFCHKTDSSRTIFALNSNILNQFLVSFIVFFFTWWSLSFDKNIYFVCFCPRIQMKCHIIFELIYYELVYFEYYFFFLCLKIFECLSLLRQSLWFWDLDCGLLSAGLLLLASHKIKK